MTATAAGPRIGKVARLKLTEPLLLYTGPPALLLVLVVLVPVVVVGAWWALLLEVPALGLLAAGIWAARASCYSPAGTLRSLRDAMAQR